MSDVAAPASAEDAAAPRKDARSRRYLGALAIALAAFAVISVGGGGPGGVRGPAPGSRLPPFAVPLVSGTVRGGANFATAPDQGQAGQRPACSVRGAGILNICQLYERSPLVLALFLVAGSCPQLADDLQALAPSFPGVAFAAVAIKGERAPLRSLIASEHLTLPLGLDPAGVLAPLYGLETCAQVDFAYPGGVVASHALITRPPPATLRARVRELVAAAEARGWRRPTGPPTSGG